MCPTSTVVFDQFQWRWPERQRLLRAEKQGKPVDHQLSIRSRVTVAEGNSWIVMSSLLVLGIGVCLEVDRFSHLQRSIAKGLPSPLFMLDEFVYAEAYDIACMTVSVLWIVFTLTRYSFFHKRENHKHVHIGNYLIYGLAFFALGGSFLVTVEAMLFFSYSCATATGRAYALMKIVYIVAQVVFIFSSRYQHIFNRTLFNGIFLFHIIVTNVTLYLRTFLGSKVNDGTYHPTTDGCNCSSNNSIDPVQSCVVEHKDFLEAYEGSSEYFAPFCLEFALTATALLAELWIEHGHDKHGCDDANIQNGLSADQPGPNQKQLLGSVTSSSDLGLLIFGSLAFMLIYFKYIGQGHGVETFRVYRLVLVSLMIAICFIGLLTLQSNTQRGGSIGLDEFLMFLSLFGVFVINLLQIIAAWASCYSDDKEAIKARSYAKISIVDNFMWCAQAALQAAFITKALHRASRKIKLANTSSLSVILIFCNLAIWVMDTVDLEDTGRHHEDGIFHKTKFFQLPELMYGKTTWMWVKIIVYPLVVFFRIHCVFTLYNVFSSHRTLSPAAS